MLGNYLIVAYLTIVSVWPFTLPVIALAAWWFFRIGRQITGAVMVALFVLVAVATWQFARYL
ncbi:TPA: hypothetical protein R4S64_002131 [Kluyvera georgiana]|nr:hypothetical protein [Kluyvera georgiana]